MIPLIQLPALAWKYRRLLVYGIAVLLVLSLFFAYRHSLIKMGRDEGRAEVQALWQKDKAAWIATNEKIEADAKAQIEATRAKNVEVLKNANEQLLAIAADRDSLSGMLRDASDRIRRLASSAATSQRGADVAAGIAARQREIDEAYDAYDKACRRDAVRFQKLQQQIGQQMQ